MPAYRAGITFSNLNQGLLSVVAGSHPIRLVRASIRGWIYGSPEFEAHFASAPTFSGTTTYQATPLRAGSPPASANYRGGGTHNTGGTFALYDRAYAFNSAGGITSVNFDVSPPVEILQNPGGALMFEINGNSAGGSNITIIVIFEEIRHLSLPT